MFRTIPKRNISTAPGAAPWLETAALEKATAQRLRGSELGAAAYVVQ